MTMTFGGSFMNLSFSAFMTIMLSGICMGGVYGLFASSFTFQLGSLSIYDFSFGGWLMLSMYLTYYMYKEWQMSIVATLLILFTLYFAVSYALGKYILTKVNENVQMLVTMGISIMLQNGAILAFTAYPRTLGFTERTLNLPGGVQVGATRLIILAIAAVIMIGLQIFLKKTWIGKTIRAVVQQKDMACQAGINANKVKNLAYASSYVLLAASGVMLLVLFPVEPAAGAFYQLMSFFICIIAGLGNIRGAFFCGVLIGVVNGLFNFFFTQYATALLFLIFVVVLVLRPKGLFTKKLAA
jgi:branched-chain amino acid transport system permease protein